MELKISKSAVLLAVFSFMFQPSARGSDADGFSEVDGVFLSLPPYSTDGRTVEFNSFDITAPTLSAFRERCAKKSNLWINNKEVKCLLFRPPPEDSSIYNSSIFIDASPNAWTDKQQLYSIVATHPTPAFSTRKATQIEKRLVASQLIAESAKQAAISIGNKSIILAGYGTDSEGNLLTRVFVISGNSITLCGKLPGWPERFIDMDDDGVPEAIINLNAEGFTVVAYSLLPSTKNVAFVGEGG